MSKKERIVELERRVAELEAEVHLLRASQPVIPSFPETYPWWPTQPWKGPWAYTTPAVYHGTTC